MMSEETTPPNRVRPDGGAEQRDINDVVEEEWVEDTTPFARVYGIIRPHESTCGRS